MTAHMHDGGLCYCVNPPDPRLPSAVSAADDTIARGGGTFRIGASGRIIDDAPRDGYAVGLVRGTYRTVALGSPWTVADIAVGILAAADTGAAYVGTWVDAGTVHIDPVAIVPTAERAYALARDLSQVAVYAFALGLSIDVGPGDLSAFLARIDGADAPIDSPTVNGIGLADSQGWPPY